MDLTKCSVFHAARESGRPGSSAAEESKRTCICICAAGEGRERRFFRVFLELHPKVRCPLQAERIPEDFGACRNSGFRHFPGPRGTSGGVEWRHDLAAFQGYIDRPPQKGGGPESRLRFHAF